MSDLPTSFKEKLEALKLLQVLAGLQDLWGKDQPRAKIVIDALTPLLQQELNAKKEQAISRRVKGAHFVRIQTVDAFDFNYNASTKKLKNRYLQLLSADAVIENIGAIFLGNAGLGKTHLARALGYAACQATHRVLFIPCSSLLNRLISAEATKDLEREVKKMVSPALLIIDELAYLEMSHKEANLFFQLISRRHDNHRPTVVTTNKPFGEWNQVFHSDATAHVIVDRLTERAEIFYLEGKSYRQSHRKGLKPAK